MLNARKLRYQALVKAVCLALWFCCGGCWLIWSGPVAVDRSEIPFLNPAVVDWIRYTPSSAGGGVYSDICVEPVQINDKESIQWVTFWLDDIFHNAPAFPDNQSINMFPIQMEDKIEIKTKYGPVILTAGFMDEPKAKHEYKRFVRDSDPPARQQLNEMYPDAQFYHLFITVQFQGRYYPSLFFPKALIHLKNNP